jgi:hypothetical protein
MKIISNTNKINTNLFNTYTNENLKSKNKLVYESML